MRKKERGGMEKEKERRKGGGRKEGSIKGRKQRERGSKEEKEGIRGRREEGEDRQRRRGGGGKVIRISSISSRCSEKRSGGKELGRGRVITERPSFIHSSISGHLSCFPILATVNNPALNTGVHISLRIGGFFFCLGFVCFSNKLSRSRIAGSDTS